MKQIYLLAIAGLLTIIPGRANTLEFQLLPSANLSALPNNTLSWKIQISNGDTVKYLQIDGAYWDTSIDAAQGSGDDFALFPFPVLAPQVGLTPTTEIDSFYSVTWLLTATGGYAASGDFVISSSLCDDASSNGCLANSDVRLTASASVESVTSSGAPEPATLPLLGGALAIVSFAARRRRTWR